MIVSSLPLICTPVAVVPAPASVSLYFVFEIGEFNVVLLVAMFYPDTISAENEVAAAVLATPAVLEPIMEAPFEKVKPLTA